MAYNITLTNGSPLVTVADGTTETNYTSLTLVGKNFAGYGIFLNENFIKLVENFSNDTPPANALQGQIWWNTSNKTLNVKNGNSWKSVSSTTAAPDEPATTAATVGDMWWDMGNSQLKVWSGSAWVVIGPAYTAAQGKTGIEASVVTETGNGNSHIITKFWVNNVVVAVLSRDQSFPTSSLTGFGPSDPVMINPGFNLSTGSAVPLRYYGDANNAINLGGYPATDFLRAGQTAPTFTAPLTVNNATFTVGTTPVDTVNKDFSILVDNTSVKLMSNVSGKDLILYNKVNDVVQDLLTLDGHTGAISVKADPTVALGVATKNYVDSRIGTTGPALLRDGSNQITGNITLDQNNLRTLGSASAAFSNVYATTFTGTATNASALGGVAASNFARTDISQPISAQLNVQTNSGISIGANGDFVIDITSSPSLVNLKSVTLNKGVQLSVKTGPSTTTNAFTVDGTTGLITIVGSPVALKGVATKEYVDTAIGGGPINLSSVNSSIIPTVSGSFDIGSDPATGGKKWNTIYATTFSGNASSANYADLAERFESDKSYIPGTVVELGGSAEITSVQADLSENVFGVISTKAAYLMNAKAGNDSTHPPVAMQGRVPVRVTGLITKGDRLVSAGNGLARAATKSEITSFNVIGRALQNKLTAGEGTVEAIVKLNS
jgi:hypothetical protein